jgi:hypothetical protein
VAHLGSFLMASDGNVLDAEVSSSWSSLTIARDSSERLKIERGLTDKLQRPEERTFRMRGRTWRLS